jgi:EmrB/QacA subfamily drug resistance transporter
MQSILVFAVVHLVLLLAMINSTAVSVAFPDITTSFNASLVLAGWVLSIYQLVAACSMVVMGKVSDVLGRKNTFLICCGLFVTGSLLAALAPNIQILIAARFIQSIGGGGFTPTTIGIIIEIFPRHRQQAIGIITSISPIGGIIGPTIGGWLVTGFGWQSIFWFNVPLVVLAMIPLFFLLKSGRGKKVQIDYAGAGLFSAFLFTFMIGLSQVAHSETGPGWLITGLLFVASVFFLFRFIRHEMKTPDPIIDLDLLRLKPFAAANVYNFIFGACLYGFTSLIPLYAVSVYSMTTIQSGYVVTARAIGSIVASILGGIFVVQWGYHRPMLLGSILASASILLFGLEFSQVKILGTEISPVLLVSAFALMNGLGTGIAHAATNNVCLDLMPRRASTITGVRGMFRNTGGAISIAIITLILQFMGNMSIGFMVVFISIAIIVLLAIPCIFAMPDKAIQAIAKEL